MTPRRIVIDSNVIISAFLFGGNPARVLGAVFEGLVRCYTSLPILDEVRGLVRHQRERNRGLHAWAARMEELVP